MNKFNMSKPLVQSFIVARLHDVKFLRAGKPVPRKFIFAKYMMVQDSVADGFVIALSVAKRLNATLLAYSPRHQCYYPFFNYDPFIHFNCLPYVKL